jgi:dTDP-glucose 4,6-dehydratase
VNTICDVLEELSPSRGNPALRTSSGFRSYKDLITFVADRPGHDRRYAINCDKIKKELGWKQRHDFHSGLRDTVSWYLKNSSWVNSIRSGEYTKWIDRNYTGREQRA